MPPAVAALAAAAAASATAAGATAATAALVSTAVTVGANLAIGIGLSFAARLLMGKQAQQPKPSNGLTEFQQPVPPRFWHYGRVQVSGPLAFFEDDGGNTCGKIILLSSRQIDAIEKHFLDDSEVTVTGSLTTTTYNVTDQHLDSSNNPKAHITYHLGTNGQAANAMLLATFGGIWTAQHRLRGIAYAVTVFADAGADEQMLVFPNHIPTYKAQLRGCLLYDPRLDSTTGGTGSHLYSDKSTWEWSENACLAVLDYLTHRDGYNIPIARLDRASFRAFADVCDEAVPLAAGGTEPRYRIATTVFMNEPRTNVLARLLEACDALIVDTPDGKKGIRGGEWSAPTVTIDADAGHILEAKFSNGADAMSRYNEITFQYRSPDHNFTEVEGDPWRDEPAILASGRTDTRNRDLTQVPSHAQARRLQKISMARDNPNWVGEIRTNFYGLNAIGERTVTAQWPELEIDEPFWIEGIALLEDGTGVSMKLRSASESSYDWDADTEEGVPPTAVGSGSGLVVNAEFESDTSWDHDTSWVIADSKADHTPGSTTGISQNIALIPGQQYQVVYAVRGCTAGGVTPQFIGGATVSGTTRTSDAETAFSYLTANADSVALRFLPTSTFNVARTNIRLTYGP